MDNGASKQPASGRSLIRLLEHAFAHAPIGIAIVNSDGIVERANRKFAEMFGLPEGQVRGVSVRDLTHPDDLQRDFDLRDEILSGARESYTVEKRYVRRDGTTLHARTTVIAMLEGDGCGYQYVSQIEDISTEKEADRQLEERAAQLELAMQAVNGGLWHMDVKAANFQTSERLAEFIEGEGATPLGLDAYLERVHAGDEDQADLSVPEQYSPIVPFESSLGAAAAGLPGRAPEDQRRVIADTPSDGRKGDIGDQAEGDDHDPGSASVGADGVGYFQRNRHRSQDGAQIH